MADAQLDPTPDTSSISAALKLVLCQAPAFNLGQDGSTLSCAFHEHAIGSAKRFAAGSHCTVPGSAGEDVEPGAETGRAVAGGRLRA